MRNKQLSHSLLLLLTALIWGIAFVAQSEGGDAIGALSFNGIRMLIGSLALLPVICFLDKKNLSPKRPSDSVSRKRLWKSGVFCAIAMTIASNVQQFGINLGTSSGKAGFLTATYIIIVPILSLFLKKKCPWNVWLSVFITLAGLYLLCIRESFSLQLSDGLVLLCALSFSVHILIIDHYTSIVDGVRLSCIQFFISGLITTLFALIFEIKPWNNEAFNAFTNAFLTLDAWIWLLYAAIMSCGVAYTLQIIGQEGVNSTIASLLMSLESVFAVLAGWVILGEMLSPKEILGCILIFVAIILAQCKFTD